MSRPLIFGCSKDDKIYQDYVLPALLNKTKITTIRPMWKTEFISAERGWEDVEKKSLYKPGDVCKVLWKSRSSPKDAKFCKICGSLIGAYGGDPNNPVVKTCTHLNTFALNSDETLLKSGKVFTKQPGEVRITQVIPITISQHDGGYKLVDREDLPCNTKRMARDDGFKSGMQMMYWLGQHYDFSKPRPFEIRRFVWIE